jgi:glycine cleavage system H protein
MIELHGCAFPEALHYHVEHNVWARRDDDGRVTVGITSYASAIAGEIVAFAAKRPGTRIEQGKGLGIVELFKVVHSVRTPVSGRIVAVNERAEAEPIVINRDPYGEGWLIRVEPSEWERESKLLVTGAAIAEAFGAQMALDGFDGTAIAQER